MFYYGAHLSIKNNLLKLIDYIQSIHGNMLQIFISNPVAVKLKINNNIINDANNIKNKLLINDVKLVIHLPYTLNISKQFDINSWWIQSIIEHLEVSELIGSIGCVIHVGKSLTLSEYDSLNNMEKTLKYIVSYLKKKNMLTHIILETAAGQGTELISEIDDFINFYNRFTEDEKEYLRLCIDTCHIFVAGYDISKKSYVKEFFNKINTLIGIRYIDLIHLNDSKKICGSCVDRHENLGMGYIGKSGLKEFIRYAFLYRIPIILETPENFIEEILFIKKISEKFVLPL